MSTILQVLLIIIIIIWPFTEKMAVVLQNGGNGCLI